MIQETASALDRIDACPGSVALAQRRHAGAETEAGRAIHEFLDRVTQVGRDEALAEIEDPDLQERCAAIDLASIPAGAESEVAFAYDPEEDRAERLVLTAHRAYPDDGRMYGTADRVGLVDGAVYVGDFKSGTMKVRARDAMQLRFLALAAARLTGLEDAHVAMLYLRHDGRWYTDRAEFDALDLEEIREQLLDLRGRARDARRIVERGGLPQLVPGSHCEHCAAAVECPAQARQQRRIASIEPATLAGWFGELGPDERGALVAQAILVEKLAGKVREVARDWVLNHGAIELPDGRRLASIDTAATVMDDHARDELARLRTDLRDAGHITRGTTTQVRVVGSSRRK